MNNPNALLHRRDVVNELLRDRADLLVIAGLGAPNWDVSAAGDHPNNFPLWGAMGGATIASLTPGLSSPEDTFGLLRDLLKGIERRLSLVSTDVERRNALAAATPSIWPAKGWLTSRTGGRTDPITGEHDYHPGLDISADRGAPVYATADGVISHAAASGAYGNLVVIDHSYGLESRYGHLSAFRVQRGQQVKRGDLIGLVGATGRATGPHLHYEIRVNGRVLNPLTFLLSSRTKSAD